MKIPSGSAAVTSDESPTHATARQRGKAGASRTTSKPEDLLSCPHHSLARARRFNARANDRMGTRLSVPPSPAADAQPSVFFIGESLNPKAILFSPSDVLSSLDAV